jgi:hypothetical protein
MGVYECPWCEFSALAFRYWTHECPDMVEALAALGVTPQQLREFSTVAHSPLNGEPNPRLRLVSPSTKGNQP